MVIRRGEIWWATFPEPVASEPGYRKVTGLPKESVANVSQVLTIDKSFLTERVGVLPLGVLAQIEAGLRLVLAI